MNRIQTIEEVSLETQTSILGGSFVSVGCSTSCAACTCSCDEKQNKSSIDAKTSKTTKKVTIELHNTLK